ncbi:hypothetical protein WEI85_31895 [Actinomycetes bacterium KLBMP 9797]
MKNPSNERWARLALIALMVPVLLATSAGTAMAAEPVARSTGPCATVLAKLAPGETVSRVVSRTCAAPGQQPVAPAGASLLLNVYRDANYGVLLEQLYGYEGPCDASGYSLRVGWNTGYYISSFGTHSFCSYVRAYTGSNWDGGCGTFYDATPYVGDYFNDRIRSFRVASAWHPC